MTEDRGAAGPYIEYDGLPVLHGRETGLPLAHPYGPLDAERSLTPGGGRLTVQRTAAHHRITLTTSAVPLRRPRRRTLPELRSNSGPPSRSDGASASLRSKEAPAA
ncbi:DUF6420 family protein [Streptomyces sp. MK5]|uniref:DUF6420 family protein n=1 Tax=Streptomyces sp. MK5 TaxID=3064253 RepID=UPI002741026D|nr:DUF6420 family protein [Streptomyces sp. MK5]